MAATLDIIVAELQALRAEVASLRAERVGGEVATAAPLAVADAVRLAGCRSESAFYRWAEAHGVKSCGRGRWSREAILAGLKRERRALSPRKRTSLSSPGEAGNLPSAQRHQLARTDVRLAGDTPASDGVSPFNRPPHDDPQPA